METKKKKRVKPGDGQATHLRLGKHGAALAHRQPVGALGAYAQTTQQTSPSVFSNRRTSLTAPDSSRARSFSLEATREVKSEGPKLVPFFKATCIYFVLWLPASNPSWFSALIKCLPIFCLWLFLLAHGLGFLLAHPSATRIFAGLVFSAVGDAFLIWQDQGYFVHGLLMFAVTHILYASAFGMQPLALQRGLVILVLSGLCYALLYPYLSGPYIYLVGAYEALIAFMGWRAMAGLRLVGAHWRWTELAAGSGALLFIISDLTIAINKFCFPVPYSRAVIMATYYAAQMLIALSVVESRDLGGDLGLSKVD
ncbi:lysoplasmalogenase TMEM86A isoform X1 [Petaurus breviceps papuanus]|uniref:lysoplasmalogenase TMEM86A isoform X1 n=1 Tax=Petaurus breviceps papuanus TaxID=3040969 RepID=UPI0036D96CC0